MKIDGTLLTQCPLFKDMEETEITQRLLEVRAHKKHYERNAYCLHAKDTTNYFGILLKGTLSIEQEDFWGNRNLITLLQPPQLFAEVFAFSKQPLHIDVLCVEACDVLYIHIDNLLHYQCVNPSTQLLHNLMQILTQKNLYLSTKLTHLGKRTIHDKVLSYLSQQALENKNHTFKIPFNRQEMADYLCVDRSALSIELSKLARMGFIMYHKNTFTLLSPIE